MMVLFPEAMPVPFWVTNREAIGTNIHRHTKKVTATPAPTKDFQFFLAN
jgi:hypothetical protein